MIFSIFSLFSNNDFKFEKIQLECLKCILKFANNTDGLKIFLKHDSGHKWVAQCIDYKKPSVSIQALRVGSNKFE